jgi:hypothetical protein
MKNICSLVSRVRSGRVGMFDDDGKRRGKHRRHDNPDPNTHVHVYNRYDGYDRAMRKHHWLCECGEGEWNEREP